MHHNFRSDRKCTFGVAPIGLKFWDQAFLELAIQKINSLWLIFSQTFFSWIFPPELPETAAGTPGGTFPPGLVKIHWQDAEL